MSKSNKGDKAAVNAPVSGSLGSSSSSNVTASSHGQYITDSSSLFPDYEPSEYWISTTDVAIEEAPKEKHKK